MPALPLAAWLAIAGMAATAGETAYQGVSQANAADDARKQQQEMLKQQQEQQAKQQALSRQEAVMGANGQAQAQTSGSLTDNGFSSFVNQLAGYPGYQGGTQPSAAKTGGSTSPDMSSILSMLTQNQQQGGQISGGSGNPQPQQPQQWFELANPVTGG